MAISEASNQCGSCSFLGERFPIASYAISSNCLSLLDLTAPDQALAVVTPGPEIRTTDLIGQTGANPSIPKETSHFSPDIDRKNGVEGIWLIGNGNFRRHNEFIVFVLYKE